MNKVYEVIIIGADTAGLTAGIYAGRKKMDALILTKRLHGQSVYANSVQNFPGFISISGLELVSNIRKQVENLGVPIKNDSEALSIEKKGENFEIRTDNGSFAAKTVIIATGRRPKPLGVKDEARFLGKGISVCALCDAPFYKDKEVAVIGGGNSAFNSAYDLLVYAKKIHLLQHRDKFIGDEVLYEQLKNSGKVEFLTGVEVREIKGGRFVEGLVYEDLKTGEMKELAVTGIFVNIGQAPNSAFVEGVVEMNKYKEIVVDPKTNATSVPGIFAAGDVTDIRYKQFIIAAADGTKALLSAFEYLRNFKK